MPKADSELVTANPRHKAPAKASQASRAALSRPSRRRPPSGGSSMAKQPAAKNTRMAADVKIE